MSPPQLNEESILDPDGECFSKLTTILYISCCYTNTEDIKREFNTRDIGHTSSVVRTAAHEMVDFFHHAMGKKYINDTILEMIMKIPRVASNESVSREVAVYIKPYIINQLGLQYKNSNHHDYLMEFTDLE